MTALALQLVLMFAAPPTRCHLLALEQERAWSAYRRCVQSYGDYYDGSGCESERLAWELASKRRDGACRIQGG